MSSLGNETAILNIANPRRLGPSLDQVVIREGTFQVLNITTNLVLTGSLNGVPISGDIVTAAAVQTLTNKTYSNPTVSGTFTIDTNDIEKAATLTTSDATPTTIHTISTSSGFTYYIQVYASATDSTGGANSGSYKYSVKGKNLAGVVSLTSVFDSVTALDGTLSTTGLDFAISGTDIIIRATGLAATTIKWFAAAKIIQQSF
jgi:hypothetical protein